MAKISKFELNDSADNINNNVICSSIGGDDLKSDLLFDVKNYGYNEYDIVEKDLSPVALSAFSSKLMTDEGYYAGASYTFDSSYNIIRVTVTSPNASNVGYNLNGSTVDVYGFSSQPGKRVNFSIIATVQDYAIISAKYLSAEKTLKDVNGNTSCWTARVFDSHYYNNSKLLPFVYKYSRPCIKKYKADYEVCPFRLGGVTAYYDENDKMVHPIYIKYNNSKNQSEYSRDGKTWSYFSEGDGVWVLACGSGHAGSSGSQSLWALGVAGGVNYGGQGGKGSYTGVYYLNLRNLPSGRMIKIVPGVPHTYFKDDFSHNSYSDENYTIFYNASISNPSSYYTMAKIGCDNVGVPVTDSDNNIIISLIETKEGKSGGDGGQTHIWPATDPDKDTSPGNSFSTEVYNIKYYTSGIPINYNGGGAGGPKGTKVISGTIGEGGGGGGGASALSYYDTPNTWRGYGGGGQGGFGLTHIFYQGNEVTTNSPGTKGQPGVAFILGNYYD